VPADAPTAFFSYSREDLDFALRLAKDLKKAGARVWMDKLDIRPGQPWQRRIDEALDTCPRVLVILSPSSVDSDNVMAEVTLALDEKKEVIPVLYRECRVPLRLRLLQYADFRTDYAQGLEELLDTVGVAQQAASSAAAAYTIPEASQPAAPDTQQNQVAAEQAQLEQQERERQAAEKARLEQVESRRVEEERSRRAMSSDERRQRAPSVAATTGAVAPVAARLPARPVRTKWTVKQGLTFMALMFVIPGIATLLIIRGGGDFLLTDVGTGIYIASCILGIILAWWVITFWKKKA
jgi:hypothetical protein